jgi:hypothetical protein
VRRVAARSFPSAPHQRAEEAPAGATTSVEPGCPRRDAVCCRAAGIGLTYIMVAILTLGQHENEFVTQSLGMLENQDEMLRRQAAEYRTRSETSLGERRARCLALVDHYEALALMFEPAPSPRGIGLDLRR